ncbi:MAG: hypothetical protein JXB62_07890 [Pirellulales bacterium]|nr:hypothetical protein [Pirellulales bacterium]
MVRCLIAVASCALVLAGCGDRRRPAVHKSSVAPATTKARSAAGSRSPHATASPDETPRSEADGQPLGREVRLGTLRLTAPEGWIRQPLRSDFTLAEFRLPRAKGDPSDGRLTVSIAGGGVEQNVERWRLQFQGEASRKPPETVEIAGIDVTTVDFSGAYHDGMMISPATEAESGYRMLGAIVPLGDQHGFIKCIGPEKTIAKHAEAFHAFLRSLRPAASDRGL